MRPDRVSLEDAVFLYTKCKMDMARKFRDGMTRRDFEKFEKTLNSIEKSLDAEAARISQSINE